MARQIGVGPTLFLMTTKAMSVLFLILFLINLPVLNFFYMGTRADPENTQSATQITEKFAQLSLGNIG